MGFAFRVAAIAVVAVVLGFSSLNFSVVDVKAQQTGSIRGQVKDQFGGAIIGATVTLTSSTGPERTALSNDEGVYTFSGLAPGEYAIRVFAENFAEYERSEVQLASGQRMDLDITLTVAIGAEEVQVAEEAPISTEPDSVAGATILRGADLDALPDDPDDLAAALQALAGPSAGPSGGQMFIDGFTGGRLPPRESIREIRINLNPFSSEHDRLGFGRIEILTRPGSDRFRGSAFFNFNDESLNSRNPFAANKAPHQTRQYGANFSGPIVARRASFFLDFERREIDDNAIINAVILDQALNPTPFSLAVVQPNRRTTFSPRFDYQLNPSNTLVGRYTYSRSSFENFGIGNFSLLSRAFEFTNTEHTVQLTETAIINQKIVNETRFQFIWNERRQQGDNTNPSVNVLESFIGGGSQIGMSSNRDKRWELINTTSWSYGRHSFKGGARLRGIRTEDFSQNNFGGTFLFTSLEQYRNTILGIPGARPAQFTIAGGNPLATVSQIDFGGFIQDDWRVRPDFTLSLGLRYENQSNISSNLNFAPRISFAWSPGGAATRQPKTVLRGGFGIFYERISENLTLQQTRFDGMNQLQFLVTDPAILSQPVFTLDSVMNVPTVDQLTAFALPQIRRVLADDIQAPYTIQSAVSLERQLPYNFTVSATFINTRTLHMLRSRNINAPLPGTFIPGVPGSGVFPLGAPGHIYQYESSGFLDQNQFLLGFNNRLSPNFTVFGRYALGKAKSDTDGAFSFPSNMYDLSSEYGRSSFDVRHRLFFGGSVNVPWGVRFNPFVIASSGRPFNITIGRDINGDGLFTDRPAFATDLTRPSVVVTQFGAFDTLPGPGDEIIPRNFAHGPNFFTVNLRVSKDIGFGTVQGAETAQAGGPVMGGPGRVGIRGGGQRGGGQRGGGRGMAGGRAENRYNLTLSVYFQNLLNRNNMGPPIGNLSSPLFGLSNSTFGGFGGGGAANRRIELQVRFSF